MRKLSLLALTAGVTIAMASPAQASVSLDPTSVPLAATSGGAPVSATVTFNISADETSRTLQGVSIDQTSNAYTHTQNCPATFPAGTQTCAIQVTLDPKAPGISSGLFPGTLEVAVGGAGGSKTATALLAGLISPALPGTPTTPGTGGGEGTPKGKGATKGKGCKKGHGKGKAKGKASSSAKKGKGKGKCRSKGKAKAKGK